jgi:hypothetical protein
MKGHRVFGQTFEDNPNIMLRPTRDAYVDVWEVKGNEFIHKLQDLFSRRWWNGWRDRTLVECIQNDVNRRLSVEAEHFFKAFNHCPITRFPYSTIVGRMKSGEYVTTGIGARRKLDEQRGKQIVKFLFINVPEIEIEIGH